MLAASLVALHSNTDLTDIDGLLDGRVFSTGHRMTAGVEHSARAGGRPLVVDDSVFSGRELARQQARLTRIRPDLDVRWAALIASPESTHLVDVWGEVVPHPRIFEWNVLHHEIVERSCFDLDGVLCVDPTASENDDGAAYLAFLRSALPLYIPSRRIGTIVTARLEKYRQPTEDWLSRQGILFDELRMLDLPDAATRRRAGSHAAFKASVYKQSNAPLFFESDTAQARDIATLSGRPVYAYGTREMFNPPLAAALRHRPANTLWRVLGGARVLHRGTVALRRGRDATLKGIRRTL